jgi:hypothetical protein
MYNTYSTQAWVYMIISVILTIVCISLNIYVQGAGLYLLLYILFIFIIFITAYNITCLSRGDCNTWGWIISLMSLIPMILVTIMLIILAMSKS